MADSNTTTEIVVSGHATVDVEPDHAEMTVRITTVSTDSAAAATTEVAELADALRDLLDTSAIDTELTLSQAWAQPRQRWDDNNESIIDHQASVSGTLRCAAEDTGNVFELVAAAGAAVHAVTWQCTDSAAETKKARALAVADAHTAATDYAEALDYQLGRLVALVDGNATTAVHAPMMRAGGAVGAAAAALEIGAVTITASVTATYTCALRVPPAES